MSWKKYKYIYIALLLIFTFSGVLSYYWVVAPEPQAKPKLPAVQEDPLKNESYKISPETEVVLQKRYKVCEKYNLTCALINKNIDVNERAQLNGLTISELEQIYKKENWRINAEIKDNKITIIQLLDGLCPEHKKVWHLGANNSGEYIAVYYGPSEVKKEGGIYRVTEIPITKLPMDEQEKIKQFNYEFYDEGELVAILDSFSELLD